MVYLEQLETKVGEGFDILLVKTGSCASRMEQSYWARNIGFSPKIAHHLREYFPSIRAMGFDTISLSSFSDRTTGKEAHLAFLNPVCPIIIIEDMDLSQVSIHIKINNVMVLPILIEGSEASFCSVIANLS